MNQVKTVIINILLTLSMVCAILLSPPLIFKIFGSSSTSTHETSKLSVYEKYDWAEIHFQESSELETIYYDYITWRRKDFSGQTINIKDGLRKTSVNEENLYDHEEYWFFGGSTTWGTGSSDEFTYPSLFSSINEVRSINYGESGYIARQSLSYLTNILLSDTRVNNLNNINVIFFDGVNDVAARCRVEVSAIGTVRESEIRKRLGSDGASNYKWSIQRTFSQFSDLLDEALSRRNQSIALIDRNFNCDTDPKRAFEIAYTMVNVWKMASEDVKSRGGSFTAILQPVAFIGNPKINYLDLNEFSDYELAEQYKAVYPFIRQIAIDSDIEFIDMSHIYDDCNYCYIDFCHPSPDGNLLIAEKLTNHLMN